jgi:A/G-specific adenine glycosylase
VLSWWAQEGRHDLPWRHTRDPWAVLVAEVMLQQTQAARVVPRYHAFLAAYPDPASCAAAPLGDVLRRWHGLGYPRRARALHAAATVIVGDHGGELPADLDALRALPGVGPYTARAVLAFAHERRAAVVDTNVGRVLARVAGRRLTPAAVQRIADDLVPADQVWAWNQAVLDLGATVCRPVAPWCHGCPLGRWCRWAGADGDAATDDDPARASAHVSRGKARFRGSDRQARGRLMAALVAGPVEASGAAEVMGVDPQRAEALVGGLVADGLVERVAGVLRYPT